MRNKKGQFVKGSNLGFQKKNKLWNNLKSKNNRFKKGQNKGEKCWNWKGGITTYERKLFLNSRYRAKRMNAEGFYTFEEWELLKKQYGYICPACRKPEPKIKLIPDHIIPLIKGGSNYIENIQPLCGSCNCKKHTKIINYIKQCE